MFWKQGRRGGEVRLQKFPNSVEMVLLLLRHQGCCHWRDSDVLFSHCTWPWLPGEAEF